MDPNQVVLCIPMACPQRLREYTLGRFHVALANWLRWPRKRDDHHDDLPNLRMVTFHSYVRQPEGIEIYGVR